MVILLVNITIFIIFIAFILFLSLTIASPEPRSPRQSHVKFRVGQVMRHKKWGYRGIIIGWDVKAKVFVFLYTAL